MPRAYTPVPTQVVVRRWDRETEDLTDEGITTDTVERIRAGNEMMDICPNTVLYT